MIFSCIKQLIKLKMDCSFINMDLNCSNPYNFLNNKSTLLIKAETKIHMKKKCTKNIYYI